MSHVIGIVWFKDELTYQKALETFTDSQNMPVSFKAWKALVERELEQIKRVGNMAIRAEFDPDIFINFCDGRGFQGNSQARIAFAEHVVLEYRKTGEGTFIE